MLTPVQTGRRVMEDARKSRTVLRHVAGGQVSQIPAGAVHMADGTAMRYFPEQGADQRGFSGTVLADEDGQLTAVNMHGNVLQQGLAAPPDGDLTQVDMAQGTMLRMHG